ncbi:universal stress protein [Curtobacterium sp. VKM Ac-1393]|uniref:universal stress protein n=1 Tax=Curtobacterium sp. VKM Ac-1393 TaxID=2783814 RepID=UPI001889C7DD|nr:universal stress protein [Curtobacterium sp. VKM Ac-1393]MBF4606893.1 universal stress protein [Curtobacterium sp. VKM Ac-1393]
MSTEQITVGVDDSTGARAAVEWVAHRARSGPMEVELVHAIEWYETEAYWASTRARFEEIGQLITAEDPDAVVTLTLRAGSPKQVLLDASERSDLLVIGAHRSRIIRSALAGSLPESIATLAAVPVVVVPDDAVIRDGTVVLGVAAGEPDAAVVFAAAEAARNGVALSLVSAWQLPVPMGARPVTLAEDPGLFREGAELDLTDATAIVRAQAPTIVVHAAVAERSAAQALAEAATEAALVVVGRKHRTTIGGAVFGSTARDLFHRTRTPVCVVPPTWRRSHR